MGREKLELNLNKMTFASLMCLALFNFTSMSLSALSHILVIIPGIYFTYKAVKEGTWTKGKSPLFLAAFVVFAMISVLLNKDEFGTKNLFKVKYFLIGILSIEAYYQCWKNYLDDKKKKWLLYGFLASTTLAHLIGLVGYMTGFNYAKMKPACTIYASCGIYGMSITYGYNVSILTMFLASLLVYHDYIKHLIQKKYLVIALIICLAGLYFSFARGGMLGVLAAFPLLFLNKNKKRVVQFYGLSILIVCTLLSFIYFGIQPKFLNRYVMKFGEQSNVQRIIQYKSAWYAFIDKPVLGQGFRNFQASQPKIIKKYDIYNKSKFDGHAHNNYLEMLAGVGIIGFVLIMLFHLFMLYESFTLAAPFAAVFFPFFFSFSVSGLFQSSIIDGEIMFFVMAMYSAMLSIKKDQTV